MRSSVFSILLLYLSHSFCPVFLSFFFFFFFKYSLKALKLLLQFVSCCPVRPFFPGVYISYWNRSLLGFIPAYVMTISATFHGCWTTWMEEDVLPCTSLSLPSLFFTHLLGHLECFSSSLKINLTHTKCGARWGDRAWRKNTGISTPEQCKGLLTSNSTTMQ